MKFTRPGKPRRRLAIPKKPQPSHSAPKEPEPHCREIQSCEVQWCYAPRQVGTTDDGFLIFPLKPTEGPIAFELPKVMPVDANDRFIDPTIAITDDECFLCHELGILCMTPIYVHIGHLMSYAAGNYRYALRLCDFDSADAIRLEIHYSNRPAWGNHHRDLDLFNNKQVEVLLHDVQILNGIHWIDFWLIRVNEKLERFRDHCAKIQQKRALGDWQFLGL